MLCSDSLARLVFREIVRPKIRAFEKAKCVAILLAGDAELADSPHRAGRGNTAGWSLDRLDHRTRFPAQRLQLYRHGDTIESSRPLLQPLRRCCQLGKGSPRRQL